MFNNSIAHATDLDGRTIVRCLKNAWKDVARFAKVVQRDELLDTDISIKEAWSGN